MEKLGYPRSNKRNRIRRLLLFLIRTEPSDCHSASDRRAGPQDISLEQGGRQGWQVAQAPPANHINQVAFTAKFKLQCLSDPPALTSCPQLPMSLSLLPLPLRGGSSSGVGRKLCPVFLLGSLLRAAAAQWPMIDSGQG